MLKLMRLFKRNKIKKANGVRYVEVDGVRYAVGIGYLVELAKAYEAKYKEAIGIDEVLVKCFGAEKVTAEAFERIILALTVSINYYNERTGERPMTEAEVMEMAERRGIPYIGRVVLEISRSQVITVFGGDTKSDEEQVPENEDEAQKKS